MSEHGVQSTASSPSSRVRASQLLPVDHDSSHRRAGEFARPHARRQPGRRHFRLRHVCGGDALEASATLRRAVTDPGTPESARQALVHGLLDGKVDQAVVDLVAEAATLRWSGGRTFAAALERQAVRGELVVADRRADLEDTEDQLFRFARFVESNPDLRNVLGDRAIDRAKRQELVGELLRGRATDSTIALAQRAVAARERTFAQTIEGYVTLAAAQKNRVVATVRVAKPLSSDQRNRVV